MSQYKNITIIGTSHIAPESIKEVEKIILEQKPQVVALELDKRRFAALLEKRKQKPSIKDILRIGLKGFLFSVIGEWVERKLGEQVGVSPGSEMLKAFKLAKMVGARVALIDQDINTTLKKFSKAMSWKEKWNLLVDIIKGIVLRKKEAEFDLAKVPSPEVVEKMISTVKKRYPNIYRVLITERNIVMARNLANLALKFPDNKIVAVVGAGHEKELARLVRKELTGNI